MPHLTGILETSLYVEDLDRSVRFYQNVFTFERLVGDERFCALRTTDQRVLLLFKHGSSTKPMVSSGGTIPPHDGGGQLHLAFAIPAGELETWERWLERHQLAIESRVRWERGGESIYFRDPDGHLLELVTPGCWAIY
ncbi:MAG: VOC family protein [Acidobacteria bacterium]|nr:VOC family protein [Acidobacteriota bacterium]MCI0627205.1 VOC family protein [Acidobacteriota bacterium]MCI0718009.1 VOC family protein [Acidobacteriota bacterium]